MSQPESWPRRVGDELMSLLIDFDTHAASDGEYSAVERQMRARIQDAAQFVSDVHEEQTRYLYVMRTGQQPTAWHARKARERTERKA